MIAIENARLFNEVSTTKDLSDPAAADRGRRRAQDHQPLDLRLQPVLDTLVKRRPLLCDAEMAFLMRREGELYRAGAAVGFSREYIEFLRDNPLKVDRGSITGRAVLERRTVQILDVATDPEYTLRESTTLARPTHRALRTAAARERADRNYRARTTTRRAVHTEADRARHDFRRPGRDRDRECAAVQRDSPGGD